MAIRKRAARRRSLRSGSASGVIIITQCSDFSRDAQFNERYIFL
jgi:hypothetical protein